MAANQHARLRRIEAAVTPPERMFVVDEGLYPDPDAEIERLRREEGLSETRDLVVVLRRFAPRPAEGADRL